MSAREEDIYAKLNEIETHVKSINELIADLAMIYGISVDVSSLEHIRCQINDDSGRYAAHSVLMMEAYVGVNKIR